MYVVRHVSVQEQSRREDPLTVTLTYRQRNAPLCAVLCVKCSPYGRMNLILLVHHFDSALGPEQIGVLDTNLAYNSKHDIYK